MNAVITIDIPATPSELRAAERRRADQAAAAAVASSSWETMQAQAAEAHAALVAEHCRAMEALLSAELTAFLMPSTATYTRLHNARLRAERAEKDLGQ